jgi:hypothetical protein
VLQKTAISTRGCADGSAPHIKAWSSIYARFPGSPSDDLAEIPNRMNATAVTR